MLFTVHLQLQYGCVGGFVCAASRWPGLDVHFSLLFCLSVPFFFYVGLLSGLLHGFSSCYFLVFLLHHELLLLCVGFSGVFSVLSLSVMSLLYCV